MSVSWPQLGPTLNEFAGNWTSYVDACYEQYWQDFYSGPRLWPVPDQRLNIKRMPTDEEGRCSTFWHLVTEGEIESARTPDLSRLERISWPMVILREFATTYPNRSSSKIRWWKNKRAHRARYVIALADYSYVVVVADRGDFVLLWTAYPVEYRQRQRKLQREYEAFWKAK